MGTLTWWGAAGWNLRVGVGIRGVAYQDGSPEGVWRFRRTHIGFPQMSGGKTSRRQRPSHGDAGPVKLGVDERRRGGAARQAVEPASRSRVACGCCVELWGLGPSRETRGGSPELVQRRESTAAGPGGGRGGPDSGGIWGGLRWLGVSVNARPALGLGLGLGEP